MQIKSIVLVSPKINCVILHCGSQSTTSILKFFSRAKYAEIFPVNVVFPTPPLLLKKDIDFIALVHEAKGA